MNATVRRLDGPVPLELKDVYAAYHGDISVLNGLNIKVREGIVTGIIGPNGAGKSTALKTFYGFLKVSRGEVRHNGQRINGTKPSDMVGRGVSFVPQNRSLFNDLTVEDNLRLGCWGIRSDKARIQEALERSYEMFPILKDKRHDSAGSMSGGQQRFLELARALVIDPDIIMLDEPTAMLAPKVSRELYDFISGLPEKGVTVVLVDQNVRQCAAVSDYLYVLDLGANRAEGASADFGDDEGLKAMIQEWLDYQID
ncbi:ABC transporter ATP-binding protein [Stappia stellulata]|uniref:ABC transporter ATP-binding protein n=1 Tax=Stappia stellulata TaxID=71235 RepID=UPI001CD25D1C|nr:ABC transporter ATP-binding protein [Stappia stellulata]MCA1241482.1 ABC transporter ATP-binding protein [Stappia stellulata]